ncbi:MAG: hypothetical protein H6810_03265 [Phycisphaeraceae bacterium]|nr:MAG: hypothetical protein H6810_03265 [Phycisphaeraceae bacterium]
MSWNKDDNWKKPGDRSHRRPRDRGKAPPPIKPDSGEMSTWEASKHRSEKRRKRHRIAWIGGGVAIVLFLLLAAAPTIAGLFAPGIIASKGSAAIAGRIDVGSVHLGWFSSQRVERVRLYDDTGTQRGDITARTDKGLLALLFAGGNYGTITLSGEIDCSTAADGRSFVEHTVSAQTGPTPPATPAGKPVSVPTGLHATLDLDDFKVTYADPSRPSPVAGVRVDQINGQVVFDGTGPASVRLSARVQMERSGAKVFDDAGRLSIDATVTDLIDASGEVNVDAATFEAKADLTDIASALLDVLPGLAGRSEAALGQTVSVSLEAKGPASALNATLGATSAAFEAHAPVTLDLAKGRLHAAAPITAGLDLARLSLLLPDRDALLGPDADLSVTSYPRVDITIEGLSVPIPPADTADLRGAGATLTAKIGALAAAVRAPGDAARRAVGFEPATVTLDAADLAGTITVRTDVNTTIDEKPSGTLHVDLAAQGLLDGAGAVSVASPPAVRGEVRAEKLVLAAFQPIAKAAGFDLTGVVGDRADLTLTAAPAGQPGAAGASATDLTLDAKADHASLSAAVRLDAESIRTTGRGVIARFDHLDPLLAEVLASSGMNLKTVTGATLRVPQLSLDLAALAKGDLSAVRVVADAGLEQLSGTLAKSGDALNATGFVLHAEASPLGDGVHVTGSGAFRLNGADAGTLDADLRATGLLDAAGAMAGLPTQLAGTINAKKVRSGAIQPFLAATGLDLEQDAGPLLDLKVVATSDTGGAAAGGSIPPTQLRVTLASEKLNADGGFSLTETRLATADGGFAVRLTNAGAPLARFVPLSESLSIGQAAGVSVQIESLGLPLDPATHAPDLPNASGSIHAEITQLALTGADKHTVAVPRLTADTTLTPGADPKVTLDGTIADGSKAGTIKGSIAVKNAFEAVAADGRLNARPVGSIEITDAPVALLAVAGVDLPRKEGGPVPLEIVAANTMGPTLSLAVTTKAAGDDIALTAAARTPWHRFEAGATIATLAGGAVEPRTINADGQLMVSKVVARQILALFLPAKDAAVEIPTPSRLMISAKTDDKGVIRGTLTLEPTTVSGLEVADANGNAQPLEPVSLDAGVTFTAPLGVLTEPDNAQPVTLNITANGSSTNSRKTRVLALTGNVATSLKSFAPSGKTTGALRLASADTGWLDALSGSGGLIAQAIGGTMRVDATLGATFADDEARSITDAAADLSIESPRLKTVSPVKLTTAEHTLVLAEPFEARWDVVPRLLDLLAKPADGQPAPLRLADTASVTLKAQELRIPLAGSTETLRASTSLAAPAIPLVLPDGSPVAYNNLDASFNTLPAAGTAGLRLSAADANRPDALAADLTIGGLPTRAGAVSTPTVTGTIGVKQLPSAILDALSGGDTASAVLGAWATLAVDARDFPNEGSIGTLTLESPQTDARFNTTVRKESGERAIVAREKPTIRVREINESFSGKLLTFFPYFGSLAKDPAKEEPAVVTINAMHVPVDLVWPRLGEQAPPDPKAAASQRLSLMRHVTMNGAIDPGEVRCHLLSSLSGRAPVDLSQMGLPSLDAEFTIGSSFADVRFDVADGFADMAEFKLPLGGGSTRIELPVDGDTDFAPGLTESGDALKPIESSSCLVFPADSLLQKVIPDNKLGGLVGVLKQTPLGDALKPLAIGVHKVGDQKPDVGSCQKLTRRP